MSIKLVKLVPAAAVVMMFAGTAALAQSNEQPRGLFGLFKNNTPTSTQATGGTRELTPAQQRQKAKDKKKRRLNTNRGGSFYSG